MELAGRRVLVVEDDYFMAIDLVRSIRRAGAEPLGPVPDPEGALALVEMADAATLDFELRDGASSVPVADALADRGTPFVFVTGAFDRIPDHHRERPVVVKPGSDRTVVLALVRAIKAGRGS